MLRLSSPEVDNNLVGLSNVEKEVVVFHLHPVVGLTVVGDEAHNSCALAKLDEVIGAEGWCTVVGQQGEEYWAENTSLRGSSAQGGWSLVPGLWLPL